MAAGMNPMDLKRGIDLAVGAVVEHLEEQFEESHLDEEIAKVGTISANAIRMAGSLPTHEEVGNEGVITVEGARAWRPSSTS